MRIGMAKTTFTKIKNILTRKDLDLSLQVRLVWYYIMPVLLYDMESWVLSHELEKCIEALEMYIYCLFRKISYRDKVTNEEVLKVLSKLSGVLNNYY